MIKLVLILAAIMATEACILALVLRHYSKEIMRYRDEIAHYKMLAARAETNAVELVRYMAKKRTIKEVCKNDVAELEKADNPNVVVVDLLNRLYGDK